MAINSKIDAGPVTIEFSPPLGAIIDALTQIDRDLSNMRTPLTDSVKKVVIPSIDANFEAGGRPPWQPLSPETLERRAREGTGERLLQVTGAMRQAATQFSRWDVGTEEAQISNWPANQLIKVAVHNDGTDRAGPNRTNHIPARPFLLLQDEDADKITEIFLDWVELRARGAWTRGD